MLHLKHKILMWFFYMTLSPQIVKFYFKLFIFKYLISDPRYQYGHVVTRTCMLVVCVVAVSLQISFYSTSRVTINWQKRTTQVATFMLNSSFLFSISTYKYYILLWHQFNNLNFSSNQPRQTAKRRELYI